MKSIPFAALLLGTALVGTSALAETTLTIESWRNDDLPIWQEKIIPAFERPIPISRWSSPPLRPPNITPR